MKCLIPEIAWHNREPVLGASFQPGGSRLATAGADTHLLIWCIKETDDGNVSIEILADLARHQKAVNVVRWSPNGELLASGDDESIIIVWKQKTEVDPPPLEQIDDQDREIWLQYKILRGHLEDIYDISWCPFSNFLVSGSVDNTAIIWDVHKGKTVSTLLDHKGFVQGVSWDPKNNHIATMSSDRIFRVFDIATKKNVGRNSRTTLPVPTGHPLHGQVLKLFYDDTLQSYFRRLDYSPDGELIAVPTGLIEEEQNGIVKHINVTYIYKRTQLKNPICMMQCGESPSLITRWSPIRYNLRSDGPKSLVNFPIPMRLILAVATKSSVLLYDTQQTTPLAVISNMHYTRLTDLTWSTDGRLLIVSSTDGYCSVIKFSPGELGEAIDLEKMSAEMSILNDKENILNSNNDKDNFAIKNNTPNKIVNGKSNGSKNTPKSNKKKPSKEPIKEESTITAMDEAAMEAWSQDKMICNDSEKVLEANNDLFIDDPTEDIKMVFEETEPSAENVIKEAEVSAVSVVPKILPKTPRRVNFITLSSPKSKKKK